jgi:hypothetical protein
MPPVRRRVRVKVSNGSEIVSLMTIIIEDHQER